MVNPTLIRYKKCLPLYEIKGHYESLSNTDTFLEMALEHDLELGLCNELIKN